MLTVQKLIAGMSLVAVAVAVAGLAGAGQFAVVPHEQAVVIPAPAVDDGNQQNTSVVAVLAGGCFWGVQAVYQHLKGVKSAVSGYTGGEQSTAQYEVVGRGTTGHAESVQVTYDPREVSYGTLLQVFFSVVHDPTQLNRQGPDLGPQYRSAIFPANAQQEKVARAYIAQLGQARVFKAAIMTKIEKDRMFFRAESYHQDYLQRNQRNPYILTYDLPKLDNMKRVFPQLYRPAPVLVAAR
jgi:peptide-methionine (S)-S-oxide reductase